MLLKQSTVVDEGFPLLDSDVLTSVAFGKQGAYSLSNKETFIGSYKALVCDDDALLENLVSPNPLVDSGHIITLNKEGGNIFHPYTGKNAKITRDGRIWKVWLHDIARLGEDNTTLHHNESCASVNAFRGSTNTVTTSLREAVIDLHERLAHASTEAMCNAVSGSKPTWKQNPLAPITASEIRKVFSTYTCLDCTLAKRNLASPSINISDANRKPGEIISADPVGKINPPTKLGHSWFILFKCTSTGYLHAYTVARKDEFLICLKQVVDWYRARGHCPRVLRTDNDLVVLSQETQSYLVDMQMTQQLSAPYRHFQNAVEREVQTVTKGVSLLLHSQPWLPAKMWNLALFHFVNCRNHTPNVHNKSKTPYHVIHNDRTNLMNTFKHTFGDLVAVGIPKELRTWKFDLRNDIGIYVGQVEGSVDTHYVYYPDDDSIKPRGSTYKVEISNEKFLQYFQRRKDLRSTLSVSIPDVMYDFSSKEKTLSEETLTPLSFPLAETDTITVPTRKSERIRRTNSRYTDNSDVLELRAFAAKITSKSALRGLNNDAWIKAFKSETDMIFNGGTLIEEQPTGVRGNDYHLIHSTMQLKIKLNDDGTINKYKARLCARGDMLAGITSSDETYSPTIGALSFATVHQIAILDNMHTCSVDVVGAYLYESYPDSAIPLYLKMEPHVAEALGLDPKATYRIKKYLYGLPDSGRAYYKGYSSHIESHGYKRTLSDPCLFVKLVNDVRTYIWIHVDDTFVASTHSKELQKFQDIIGLKYDYTVEADVESYLGLHRTKLRDGGIRLTQPKLLAEVFDKYEPSALPGTSKVTAPQSTISEDIWDVTPIDRKVYLSLLGALIYLTKSRPDIATAISFAATHSVNPTAGAYKELLRCVQYLWNTQEAGLVLHPGKAGDPLTLRCYVDASYLTHSDSKSHTGYCLSFGSIGTFYSKSSKQTLVTTSSTHAEMRALYQLVLDIIYVVHLCDELGRPITLPAIVLEDNQPVIDLSKELTKRSKKCKHFLMLINFIREQVQNGLIELQKVPTEDNLADILTKIVTGSQFTEKAEQLLGLDWKELLKQFSSSDETNEFA